MMNVVNHRCLVVHIGVQYNSNSNKNVMPSPKKTSTTPHKKTDGAVAAATEYELGALLNDTWNIFSEHFKTIALTVLVISVPIHLILSAFVDYSGPDVQAGSIDFGSWLGESWFGPQSFVIVIVASLAGIIIPLAIATFTQAVQSGETLEFKEVLSRAIPRWPQGIVTMIVMGVLLLLLFMLFIIPGVIFAIYWLFAVIAVALTDTSALDALSYSKQLVRGRWWKIFGYVIVMGILMALVWAVVGGILSIGGHNYITDVLSNILGDIISAFFVIGGTLLFLNLQKVVKPS